MYYQPPPTLFRPSVGSDEWTANIRLRDTISLATTIHGDEWTQGCRPWGCLGAHPHFGRSVNPISTRGGADYAPTSLLAPPDFQTFLRPWNLTLKVDASTKHLSCWVNFLSRVEIETFEKSNSLYVYVISRFFVSITFKIIFTTHMLSNKSNNKEKKIHQH